MSVDCFTNTNIMTSTSISMTKEEWEEYFKWEDEMKRTHGDHFKTGERCFLRTPFLNSKK